MFFSNRFEGLAASTKREKQMDTNSIVLGLYLSVSMITKLITTVVTFDNNIIVFVLGLLIVFLGVNLDLKIPKSYIYVNFAVIIWFGVSIIISVGQNYTWNYLLNYLLYGAVGMLFCAGPLNYEKVFRTIAYIFIPYIAYLVFVHIPKMLEARYLVESMDISYTLLHGICAVLISWKLFSKFLKCVFASLVTIGIYYMVFLSSCRGAVLALATFVLIYYMSKKKYKTLRVFLIFAITMFVFLSWDMMLEVLYQMFPDANWLQRIIFSSDLLSGRDILYQMASDLIERNFLFGIGIGGFETYTGGSYSHNIFLQVFCELGLPIGLFVSVVLVIWVVKSILNKEDSFQNKFEIFLICQFIPRLLLSSVHWMNSFIWIYIFLKMTRSYSVEYRKSIGEFK